MTATHMMMLLALLVVSAGAAYWIMSTVVDAIIWIVDRMRTYRKRPRECLNCMAFHIQKHCPFCGSGDYEYL